MLEWLLAVASIGGVVALAADHWRQIKKMRTWGAAHGLPLMPPVSRMRLARAIEALEPTMGGLWDGLYVRLRTRPVWVPSPRGFSRAWRISIRVTAEGDLVPFSAPPPGYFSGLEVRGRELRVFTWGGVPMEEIPRYLNDAVAYARALTPAQPQRPAD